MVVQETLEVEGYGAPPVEEMDLCIEDLEFDLDLDIDLEDC